MAIEIKIADLATERKFTDYHAARGELRDCLRYGVYPNLVKALTLYQEFVTAYGPGGAQYDEQLWAYYQEQVKPIGATQAAMFAAGQSIVDGMQAVEQAAPGTFGI